MTPARDARASHEEPNDDEPHLLRQQCHRRADRARLGVLSRFRRPPGVSSGDRREPARAGPGRLHGRRGPLSDARGRVRTREAAQARRTESRARIRDRRIDDAGARLCRGRAARARHRFGQDVRAVVGELHDARRRTAAGGRIDQRARVRGGLSRARGQTAGALTRRSRAVSPHRAPRGRRAACRRLMPPAVSRVLAMALG
ncbi:hypothetical protein X941_5624 [Burkholderia pseudomallei MSHR5569]|nr:hypothetical protein X941_5624 [Burkholderia pseudomallei MSHR5569]